MYSVYSSGMFNSHKGQAVLDWTWEEAESQAGC